MKNLYSTTTLTNCKNTGTASSFKLKTQWIVMIVAFFAFTVTSQNVFATCYNVTNAGTICADESRCGSYDPANITNVTSPSGGSGTLYYIWQKSTDGGSTWTTISGATGSTYDPGSITVTTKFKRGAKKGTICTNYLYSNIVTKTVTPCCDNVTNAGTIGYDESKCGPYDPANIVSLTLPSGGSGTIEYVWYKKVGSGNWELISGATGTSYDPPAITVTTTFKRKARRSGCTDYIYTNFITKTVTSGITASCSSTAGTCANGNVGTATVTPSGGSSYTYLWNTGATTQTISGLAAGTYSVTVTSSGGCTATCSTTLTCVPCCNVTDGGTIGYDETRCSGYDPAQIVNVTSPSGGSGTISYVWYKKVGSGNWELISGATGSTYDPSSITQTTSYQRKAKRANCTDYFASNIVVKSVLSGITASCVPTNGTCANGNLGSATVNVSGGSGYTYLWSNGATTQTITGLAAGTYSVVVSAGGCNANCSVTITTANNCNPTNGEICYSSPSLPNSVFAKITWQINPSSNTITLRTRFSRSFVDNTYGTNAVSWPSGHTFSNLTGSDKLQLALFDANAAKKLEYKMDYISASNAVPSGYKSLGVLGGDGGMVLGSASSVLSVTTSMDVNFNTYGYVLTTNSPATDANYTVNPSYPNWIYDVWYESVVDLSVFGSAGFGYPEISLIHASPSKTGNNSEPVDSINCPGPNLLNISVVPVGNPCGLTCNGAVNSTVTGGVTPFSYAWSNGSTTSNLSNVCAGTYSVTVTDATGATATASATVANVSSTLSLACNMTNVTTYGASNGIAAVIITGGTGPFTYLWNTGATSASLTNVPAGVYSVTVTDSRGCSAFMECYISQPPFDCTGFRTQTQGGWGQCQQNGGNPGTYLFANFASAFPSGLTVGCTNQLKLTSAQAVCEFLPSGSTPSALPSGTLTSPGGSYNNVLAGQVVALTVSLGFDQADASFGSSPALLKNQLISSGTFAGWTVQRLLDEANRKLGGCSSSYSFSQLNDAVTKVNENFVDGNVTGSFITCCGSIVATCTSQPANCFGGSTGSVSVTATGGSAPYTYLWSNGATTASVNNVPAGTYSVTVTSSNNCTATCTTTVTQPAAVTATCSKTDAGCNGTPTGSVSVVAAGGIAPYTYLWSNGSTAASQSGLAAGTYSVTVKDARNCTATCSVTVGQPTSLPTATCSGTNVSCKGGSNGTASVVASGGTAPYTYLWSNGATTSSISNLAAATYSVVVTDSKGCQALCSYCVTEPPQPLQATCSGTDAGCNGTATGSVSVTASGGTAPYTYLWNNGATTASQSNLPSGTYSVTVKDSKNCTATCSKTINQPSGLQAICNGTNVNCNGASTGSASVTPSGGATPYTYLWSNGATTASLSNLAAGTYSVTVTDRNNCTATCTYTVTQPQPVTATCSKTDAGCNGTSTGSVSVVAAGGTAPYTYLWSNSSTTASQSGLAAGTYSVTVKDARNCTATCSVTVGQPTTLPTATCSGTNVSCNGGSNGTASVVASGGTAPYTYLWSNGATTSSITGLAAATYSVVVTDANGCQSLCSYCVTQPELLRANCEAGTILCYGASTGSVVTLAQGGTAPYTYLWNNGATTASQNGLPAGTYSVTIKDAKNCTATCSITVTQPQAPLTAQCTFTKPACYGASTGSVTVAPAGGTAPYTYLWNTGATTASVSGLPAGTYNVVVTDSKGCTYACSSTITQPAQLIATCTSQPAGCFGAATGSASVTVQGGTAPFTYAWTGSTGTTSTITGLIAGTYTVTVTDYKGCTATCTATVTQASSLSAVCSGTNVACNGNATGTAAVVASGGTAPYTYLWSNGATTASISLLPAATYTVVVTDANGCQSTCTYTVTQPELLRAICEAGRVNCYGDATGSAVSLAQGGTAPYSYLWSNGETTSSIDSLLAGSYTVTITDAQNCTATCTIPVLQPASPLTAQCTATNPGCFGASTGSVTVAPAGGTAPYTYLWNNGAISASVSGLPAGTYTVVVTDSKGCTYTCSSTITHPAQLIATCSSQPAACFGSATGSATVTVQGGTAPFTYAWSGSTATTSTITGLVAGTYTVTVTDSKGCTATCTATVDQASGLQAVCSGTNVDCNGNATGSAAVAASGGTAPYTYLWSNGATTDSLTGLVAGTYTVTVKDANQCSATCAYTVTQPGLLRAICEAGRVNCYGDSTGSAVSLAQGGTAPYTYLWSNGETTSSIDSLPAGSYTITITDANNCTATCTIPVLQPQGPLTATCDSDDAACFGALNGSASVVAGGGTAPYTYLWSNGAITASLSGLAAGTYSVTVTDSKGCTATCSVVVGQASTLNATCGGSAVNCFGNATGSANVFASGGTAPYTYLWNNGSINDSISGVVAGIYSVTVTDAHGCTATCSFEVTQPSDELSASTEAGMVSCNGGSTGEVVVLAQGGTAPYTYLWSNGATTAFVDSIPAGSYSVTVTDGNGCTATSSITVTQPPVLVATCSSQPAACFGSPSGSVSVTASGGTAPYSYLWNTGATTSSVSGLGAGTYSVTVTDSKNCSKSCSTDVSQADTLEAICSGTNATCFGTSTGTASVIASGGTAPYTYLWSTGATTSSISGLAAAIYTVLVTDANGCTAICTYCVTQPDQLLATCSGENVSCNGGNNGSAGVTVTGGTAPFTYVWSNGETTASIDSLSAATYTVIVTDANGCTALCSYCVTQPLEPLQAVCEAGKVLCYGESTGSAVTAAQGGTAPYTYLWSNGETTASIDSLPAGQYSVTVTDANGCTATCSIAVTQPQQGLRAECGSEPALCYGDQSGSANVNVFGGTGSYVYLWSNGATGSTNSGVAAGTYSVTVTDANGCTDTCSVVVGQAGSLEATCSGTAADCYASSTGSADVSVSGGTAPYTYLWSNGSTEASVDSLAAGAYTVTVTDANECIATCTYEVSQPAPYYIVCSSVPALCYQGSTGSASVAVSGGTAPYTYAWDNGATTDTVTGLAAGTYTVIVTDAHGCQLSCSSTVDQAPMLEVNLEYGDASCGLSDACATAYPSGGTAPYTFFWSNETSGPETCNLAPGSYTVTVTDYYGCTVTREFHIEQANCPPLARNDYNNTIVNVPVGGDASTNDSDPDGDNLTFTQLTTPSNGTVVFNNDGSYTYTPATDFVGDDSFEYYTCDDGTPIMCDTATVYITVIDNPKDPFNNPPVANADDFVTYVDVPVNGTVIPNDFDPDAGDVITVTGIVTNPSNGTVTINPNGTFTYTPGAGFTGEDSFVYNLCDNGTPGPLCDTAVVVIHIKVGYQAYNNPPVAVDDAEVTEMNTPVNGNSSSNDYDVDGDNLTFTQFTNPSNGSVVFNTDGSFIYTPNNNYVGPDHFLYYVCDDGVPGPLCDTATVYITILTPGNNPPLARNDYNNTIVNVPVGGDASTNDSDPDGDNLTFTQLTTPSNGTVVFNNDGSYTYTPNTDYVGDDSFDYYTCDDGIPSLCDTATVYITIINDPKDPFNNPPVANADDFVTFVDVPVNGTVIPNDFDPDAGDVITVTGIVTNPSNGTVTINPNGTFVYTPNTGFEGEDSFIYNLCDNGTPGPLCDTAVVVIHINGTIDPDNNPPVAVDDAEVTEMNTPVGGDASSNDYDVDGDNLVFTQLSNPSNGSVVFNPNGSFIYTPNNNYVGPDHFTYYVCDDGIPGPLCDTATVYITILSPANNPPIARNDFNNTIVNVPVGGDASTNDSDPDGDNLTFTQLTTPSNGTVVFNNDGSYTYTPNTDYVGDDSFDYYTCDDGTPSLCDTATVYITIIDDPKNPDNNPPVANADDFVTFVDVPVNGTVIPNDFDPDAGDLITVTAVVGGPSNGTVTVNPNGTFTYTPNSGYTGEDSFVYNLCDNGTPGPLCDTAIVVIHINGTIDPDNNPPVAVDDAEVTDMNTPVSGDASSNDYDVDGDNLVFTQLSNPSNGSVVFNPNGTFTYTPNNNYVGPDHFTYYVCDDGIPGPLCDTATVYITILTPGNNPPVARNDFNNTLIDIPVDGDASTNDSDPDGDNLIFTQLTTPSNGTVVFNTDGSYTYTPNSGFTGDDNFDYYICDDGNPSLCDTATVFITVIPPHAPDNNPPVANADDFITYVDMPVSGTVIPNDFDPDTADVITVTGIVTSPSNGTVTINPDGTFTYTPNTGYEGDDTFVYNLCDNGTPGPLCDTALVVIHVLPIPCCNPTNLPPVAVDDANITQIDIPVSGNLLTNDYDPNPGDIITINTAPVSGPSHGSVVINPDGSYTYTPNAGYTGPDNFVYFICDNGTPGPLCDTATCYITVWSQMSIALVPTPASCNGVCDGSINLTVTNGSAPFTYAWSNGATTEDISALCAGWYTVTVTDVYGTTLTDSAEVTQPAPVVVTVTPSGPTTFCEGGSLTLTATAAAAYVWSPNGETTQSIVVTASGAYSVWVMDASGCEGTSAPITVTVNPNPTPVVTAGGPTTFCTGGSVTLTSTAASTYLWSPNGETTQSIVVTASGDYGVTVTDVNGCQGASAPVTVTVTSNPTPLVSVSGPTEFCEGGSVTLTSTAAVSYVWSPNGETTQSITITAAGSYSVTIVDANGCTGTSAPVTVIVHPNPIPTVTTSGPTTFCQGDSVTLTSTAASVYVWSPNGETTQSIVVTASGDYSVWVMDANGCEGTSAPVTVTVTNATPPTITPDGATTLCEGECVNLTATYTGVNVTLLWSNGATTPTINVCASGTFTVTITDENGCTATSGPISVIVNPSPVPTITPDGPTSFCMGNCITLTADTGYTDYIWSTGDTTQSITVCESGVFVVTVFDVNGCRGVSAPLTVTVTEGLNPTVTADGPTTMCEGDCVVLTSSAGVTYQWSNGATTQSITVCDDGSFSVSVTDIFGCSGTSVPVVVTVNPNPVPTVTPDGPTEFCQGQCVTLSAPSGYVSYLWSNGAATPSITVCATGDYSVTVTDANGCSGTSAPVHVQVGQGVAPVVTANGPTEICEGSSVTLTASSPNAVSYQWYRDGIAITGATGASITVSDFADYYVMVTDQFGCVAQSNLVLVKVGEIPNVNAGEDQTICPGDNVTLTASGATDYVWSNGESTASITVSPAQATDYIVTGTNPFCGQADTDTVHVSISSLPIAAAHASDDPSLGNPVNFTDISGDNTIVGWLWDFGDGNSAITQNAHHTYDSEGTFTIVLTVENEFGCSNYDTVQVDIDQTILIPNIITPNSDGLNDALSIKNNGVENYGLTIFNRWGQVVFQREAREIVWQGTTNSGVDLESGTYFYVLKVKNSGSKGDFEKTGFLTLVR